MCIRDRGINELKVFAGRFRIQYFSRMRVKGDQDGLSPDLIGNIGHPFQDDFVAQMYPVV
jgi:hypothetical protein